MDKLKRVVLFGRTGDGKSTVANVLVTGGIDEVLFKFSDSARGCTTKIKTESRRGWRVTDTLGVGEASHVGAVTPATAKEELTKVLKQFRDSYSHIVYVQNANRRTTQLDELIWSLFEEIFAGAERAFVVLFTHANEDWLDQNRDNLPEYMKTYPILATDIPPARQRDLLGDLLVLGQNDRHWSIAQLETDLVGDFRELAQKRKRQRSIDQLETDLLRIFLENDYQYAIPDITRMSDGAIEGKVESIWRAIVTKIKSMFEERDWEKVAHKISSVVDIATAFVRRDSSGGYAPRYARDYDRDFFPPENNKALVPVCPKPSEDFEVSDTPHRSERSCLTPESSGGDSAVVGGTERRSDSPMSSAHMSGCTPPASPHRCPDPGGRASSPCNTRLRVSGMSVGSSPNPVSSPLSLHYDVEAASGLVSASGRARQAASHNSEGSTNADHDLGEQPALRKSTYSIKQRGTGIDLGNGGPPEDGFTWKKYGQKNVSGSNYPRNYYRCAHMKDKCCPVRKSVQQSDEDPSLFDVTYSKTDHTCQPTQQSTSSIVKFDASMVKVDVSTDIFGFTHKSMDKIESALGRPPAEIKHEAEIEGLQVGSTLSLLKSRIAKRSSRTFLQQWERSLMKCRRVELGLDSEQNDKEDAMDKENNRGEDKQEKESMNKRIDQSEDKSEEDVMYQNNDRDGDENGGKNKESISKTSGNEKLQFRLDIQCLGLTSWDCDFNPNHILALGDVTNVDEQVHFIFFHVKAMANLFGVGLPYSKVSISLNKQEILIEEMKEETWKGFWMISYTGTFKPFVFGKIEGEMQGSSEEDVFHLDKDKALSNLGIIIDGLQFQKYVKSNQGTEKSIKLEPTWKGWIKGMIDHVGSNNGTIHRLQDKMQILNVGTPHQTISNGKKKQVMVEQPSQDATQRLRGEADSGTRQDEGLVVNVTFVCPDCPFFNFTGDREAAGKITDGRIGLPGRKSLIKPFLTVKFFRNLGSKQVSATLDVQYQMGSQAETWPAGWFQDYLRLSFGSNEGSHQNLRSPQVISEMQRVDAENVMKSGTSTSYQRGGNVEGAIQGSLPVLWSANGKVSGQLGTADQFTQNDESRLKPVLQALKDNALFCISNKSVDSMMEYEAFFWPTEDPCYYFQEKESKYPEARASGLQSNLGIRVEATWDLFGNETHEYDMEASKKLSRCTSTRSGTEKILQIFRRKFIVNHDFSQFFDYYKKQFTYDWMLLDESRKDAKSSPVPRALDKVGTPSSGNVAGGVP